MLHATYLPTGARVAELAVGAALGTLLASPAALKAVQRRWGAQGSGVACMFRGATEAQSHPTRRFSLACRRTWVSAAALCLQAAYVHQLVARPLLFRRPGSQPWPAPATRLQAALLWHGSPFMAALVAASLLALLLGADPLHAAAARLLCARAWAPLARLSYAQYLISEHARLWALLLLPAGTLPQLVVSRPLLGFVAVWLGGLAAALACALPLHLLVERRWAAPRAA